MPDNHPVDQTPKDFDSARPSETMEKEIRRIKNLREDILLLRFHLARRTDIAELISDTDRHTSEISLHTSLEVLEWYESGTRPLFIEERDKEAEKPTTEYIAASTTSLMHAVDVLGHAARMAQEKDATGDIPPPVTPESLRHSLPEDDIAKALGLKIQEVRQRKTARSAKEFIGTMTSRTLIFFFFALLVHLFITRQPDIDVFALKFYFLDISVPKDLLIPIAAFFWAMTGSIIWILIRFRRFGAAYAFDPSHAEVYWARVLSGSVTTSVLLYFVFGGGAEAWAENWQVNLPLTAFVLGYAGRLQVELLRNMVERVEGAFSTLTTRSAKKNKNSESNDS